MSKQLYEVVTTVELTTHTEGTSEGDAIDDAASDIQSALLNVKGAAHGPEVRRCTVREIQP